MKAFTDAVFVLFASSFAALALASGCDEPNRQSAESPGTPDASSAQTLVIIDDESSARPPFDFSDADEALLDEIQYACFRFFWDAVIPETGMVVDRTSGDIVSVAGVGFQLSAIPIGIERGWITRDEGEERALLIVESLADEPSNRKGGLFFHYLDGTTAKPHPDAWEHVVSTIDSGLLFAGILTASSYFGGEVAEIGDRLIAEADWTFFQNPDPGVFEGFISLGWRAEDINDPTGDGTMIPHHWIDSGDEHRLVTFLAVCAPDPEHRADPTLYYRLRRSLGTYADSEPFVWFPYSGALFTDFFAHCWIDHAGIGVDDPASFGIEQRSPTDWWVNSKRVSEMHINKARENPHGFPTLGQNRWGLGACDGPDGYLVAQHFPNPVEMPGALVDRDVPAGFGEPAPDVWHEGTIAPYNAGSAIMFVPEESVAALREYRTMTNADGEPLIWRAPEDGGYGFQDSFILEHHADGSAWVAPDNVAIDQGPLILAIENARTGRVWDWFHAHPSVRAGMKRLQLER